MIFVLMKVGLHPFKAVGVFVLCLVIIEVVLKKGFGTSIIPSKHKNSDKNTDRGPYDWSDEGDGGDGGDGDIWISASPDLIHWGEFKPVLAAGYRFWNVQKIGPTPPIKTDQGWLDIIHGVFTPAGGTYYYIGAMLLDLDEPWKVIGKTNSYLMMPEEPWEQHGNCDNVIFPCGAIADYDKDQIRLYYGACDFAICLATGSLSETVAACIQGL